MRITVNTVLAYLLVQTYIILKIEYCCHVTVYCMPVL